ncbi:MAG TPA: response regulator FixJ [Phenylobacterium sp.]|jgi:two-component system response regulator FixJ
MSGAVVHVVDDDDAVRDALARLLEVSGYAVRAYPSAGAFLERFDGLESGCVVTDVQMPGISGLELLRRLSGRAQEFPTIVLTGLADVPMAVDALKAGAADFIEKPFDGAVLLAALGAAFGRLTREQARSSAIADNAGRLAGLSARERDVLGGIVAGASNKEIARDLDISPRTVESYRANIMMKTKAQSLSELVRITIAARP